MENSNTLTIDQEFKAMAGEKKEEKPLRIEV